MRIILISFALSLSLVNTTPVQGIVPPALQLYASGEMDDYPSPSSTDESFQKAVEIYNSAEFDKAINLFSQIAMDNGEDRLVRRDALHYLGRSYVALRKGNEARNTVTMLADFEPPRINIDPDVEAPQFLRLYYDVHKERDGGYDYGNENSAYTMAVVDFTNQSIDDHDRLNPLSKGFSSLMINQLNGSVDLKVVERERLNWLLDELNLQQDESRVDQQTAVQAGRLLGVQMVLFGTYMKFGKTMNLSVRLVSVETGEILMTEQVRGKADDFFDLAETLSISIAKSINVNFKNEELSGRFRETRSLDALLSYSEGLDYLENQNFQAAYRKFIEAYDYDHSYKRAFLKAKSIEPFVSAG